MIDALDAAKLLRLAADLPAPTVNKMAHALGWPSNYTLAQGAKARRAKWANPYRNHYSGPALDSDWLAAQALGLAKIGRLPSPDFPDATWTVTDLGCAVVRVRLQAVQLAYRVNA